MNKRVMRRNISEDQINRIVDGVLKEIKEISSNNSFQIKDYFDLDKLTKQDIKDICVDYRTYLSVGFGYNVLYANGKLITEIAEKTSPINEVISELKTRLKFKDWQIEKVNGANGIGLILLFVNYNMNKECVIKEMESMGWSMARTCDDMKWGIPLLAIHFDPIHQNEVTPEAMKFNFLFHWTPSYNEDGIRKNGLQPRSQNKLFSYRDHVHIMKGNIPEKQKIYLGRQLCEVNYVPKNNGLYKLIQIETAKITDTVKFYYDPRYEWGYYTNDAIPPSALTVIGEINFKNPFAEDIFYY